MVEETYEDQVDEESKKAMFRCLTEDGHKKGKRRGASAEKRATSDIKDRMVGLILM